MKTGYKLILSASLIVIPLLVFYFFLKEPEEIKYLTTPVQRSSINLTIKATGVLEPEEVVDIGAQVAGKIISFGIDSQGDTIDYGSQVEEGTVLARIDDALYAADLALAEAQLAKGKADLQQLEARLFEAEQNWRRIEKVGPSQAISQSNFDGYRAAYQVAKANVSVGSAAIAQAEAALLKANRNLGYCTIISPVKGVIIDRRVNIGQTVVASLNAPSLFLIAKDLDRIQIWAAVNEADIGVISPNQKASFSVDAFPGEIFEGTVQKIRLNASMTQNVVTYIVEVSFDNSSRHLLPYLTANVEFAVNSKQNVLLVPNSALRWEPKDENLVGQNVTTAQRTEAKTKMQLKAVWLLTPNGPTMIEVNTGLTDGKVTEIESPKIAEGDLVIIGENSTDSMSKETGTSPFAPKIFGGRGRSG